ncbi:putative hydrolase, NUDIX family [Nocardia nova SH22a]|uniref:Putative hydrolase, NUDIX family n=1 Tax=Nocardia nova SH22a TaxID=1415166 RepID=W5TQC8_9NOCA|nr:putative hydrolase, NUDIX family [Nocardia nova SH22a]
MVVTLERSENCRATLIFVDFRWDVAGSLDHVPHLDLSGTRGLAASTTVVSVSDTRWTILGERLVDENRHIRLSTADIRLPDGVEFTQYVARIPRCAMTLVLNDNRELLLMYRHRWIIDQWVWELPGGYVDHAEDVAVAAAREVEEETGWRPRAMQHLVTYQPAIGTLDHPQEVYLARGADLTDTRPDVNEAETIRWVPLDDAVRMIERGEIVGAATLIGVYRAITLTGL